MKDFLATAGMFLALASIITFLIGFVMLFIDSKKKLGLKILIYSVIAFVVGFSTCAVNFSLGPMH